MVVITNPHKPPKPFLRSWGHSLSKGEDLVIATCLAEVASIPFDTLKVRMQMWHAFVAPTKDVVKFVSLPQTAAAVLHGERLKGLDVKTTNTSPKSMMSNLPRLWAGLVPGLLRQAIGSPVRMFVYDEMKRLTNDKLLSGVCSTIVAQAITTPFSLLKVRLQMRAGRPFSSPDTSLIKTIQRTYGEEGLYAFWKGLSPNVARSVCLHVAELVTYDLAKTFYLSTEFFEDNITTHAASGLTAGFVAAIVISPFDMLKTRMMSDRSTRTGRMKKTMYKIIKNEGISGFYRGFSAHFIRIGTWNVVMFSAYEQLVARRKARQNENE